VTMLYSPPSARNVERIAHAAHEVSAKQAPTRAGKSRRQIRAAAVRKPGSAKHAARPAKNDKHAKHAGKSATKRAQAKLAKPGKKTAIRVAEKKR